MNNDRRAFLRNLAFGGFAAALPAAWTNILQAAQKLPRRPIPGSEDELAVVGLGNSNAFREGDQALSRELIDLFGQRGGNYIDCSGPSRFVVAEAGKQLGIAKNLFLGTYFTSEDDAQMRDEIRQLLELTGKDQLDLAQSYPEFAIPNWRRFEAWKADGLVRHIGIARHQARFYEDMMGLMETGTVDLIQVNYSPLETEADREILPLALDKGVAVTINRPFINGQYFSLVQGHEVPPWAAEFDCDNWAAFSLKFILSHPAVTCVLTETANPRHAIQNIEAGFGALPDEKTRARMAAHLKSL